MLTREECRSADKIAIETFRIPSVVLMENAGRSCAETLLWHSPQFALQEQAVVILCGPGNNGGDGFVIARHLYNRGIDVEVVLFARPEKYRSDALLNLDALSRLRMKVVEFDSDWSLELTLSKFSRVRRKKTTWIVDALLGTGATGEPRRAMATAIDASNRMDVRRLAVDIPTGVDANTGAVSKATFRANITCTFIDVKKGFENDEAKPFLGLVTVGDIGLPPEILDL